MRFIAMASASCASGDSAPSDIPALSKRGRMASTGSTSSSGTAGPAARIDIRSRNVATGRFVDELRVRLVTLEIAATHSRLQRTR